MTREHSYSATVTWTGNSGQGTAGYKAYTRATTTSPAPASR